jgi:hypothetical protein
MLFGTALTPCCVLAATMVLPFILDWADGVMVLLMNVYIGRKKERADRRWTVRSSLDHPNPNLYRQRQTLASRILYPSRNVILAIDTTRNESK